MRFSYLVDHGRDEVVASVKRITGASEEEFREFVDGHLEDPEVSDYLGEVTAKGNGSRINLDQKLLTYDSPQLDVDRLEELYLGEDELLTEDQYRAVVRLGVEDLEALLERNDIDSRGIST